MLDKKVAKATFFIEKGTSYENILVNINTYYCQIDLRANMVNYPAIYI